MRKLIVFMYFYFIIAFVPNFAGGQQDQAMLKIVKSDDSTVKIYDMQSNEINFISKHTEEFKGPGEPKTMVNSVKLIPQNEAGNITRKAQVVPSNGMPSTLETNSDKQVNDAKATVLNPGPDLICGSTWANYVNPPFLEMNCWVENVGTEPSGFCSLSYFLSKDLTIGSDILLQTDLVNSLLPGQTQSFSRTLDFSSHPGDWYILLIVDSYNVVAEDDESNNELFRTTFIYHVPGPNLTVNYASYTYYARQLNIQTTVMNNGTLTAGSSILGFYLSSDRNISLGDIKLGDLPVFSLSPGAQSAKTFVVSDVGNYVPSGSYYVGVVVDETSAVPELYESDNTWSSSSPIEFSTSVEEPNTTSIPASFALEQNYPNPFNPETVISYSIPSISTVRLTVCDVLGKEVVSLVNEVKQPGVYHATFNGDYYPNGLYFYSLEASGHVIVRKMMLLK